MSSLYIVMPAYNEEGNIENVVKDWYKILNEYDEKSKLVVADKGSTDNTHNILQKMQKDYPKLEILDTEHKEHGPKVMVLYKHAIKNNADWIFQTDSDGQTNPNDFNGFYEASKDYDIILGNRTERGDGKDRAMVEKVVCFLIRTIFGVSVPDANAPFRLMKSSVLSKYINKLPNDYNLPNIMLTTYLQKYGEKIKFKNIEFKPRTKGKNSINLVKIIKIGWKAVGDFMNFKKDMRKDLINHETNN